MTDLQAIEGGLSNSRPTPESWNRRGIDTIRYRFRGDAHGKERFARSGPYNEGARGELYRQEHGIRLGAARDGMLYVEGRLAAILHGSDDHSLQPLSAVPAGATAASEHFGFHVDASAAALGRLDVATEIRFPDGRAGLAFLHALSLADVPWAKVGTEGKKRERLETVVFRSLRGRTVLMRAYDKGVESGLAPAGQVIRFERQRRFRKQREPSIEHAATYDLDGVFVGRELRSLMDVSAEVVCDLWGAVDRLNDLARAEVITAGKADLLAGFLARNGEMHKTSTRYSRWADLRRLGIIVDPLARDRTSVPVGSYLRAMADQLAA